jgi:transmembrane sensor
MTARKYEPDWETLATYFAGEASAHEMAAIEAWAAESEANARSLEQLRHTWSEAGSSPSTRASIDTEAGWARMRARMGAQQEALERTPPLISVPASRTAHRWDKSSKRYSLSAAAAAAILIAASSVFVWRENRTSSTAESAPLVAMREYTATRGQRANIHLADGTQVVLAPDSKLRVPENFGSTTARDGGLHSREVSLQGTAYFSVVHDEKRPFLVRTSTGTARDLGTEFQVRAYNEMRGMEVTVVSGLVSIERAADSTSLARLTRGDRATLSSGGDFTLAHSVNLGAATAWKDGKLVFDGTPLRQVAIALSRWYDLDVQLGDNSIAARHLALTLEDESPDVVLSMIALSLDLRVERTDHTVRLYPRRSTQKR